MDHLSASLHHRLHALYSLPEVLAELLEACLADASTPELADIVLKDGPLAARVIDTALRMEAATVNPCEPVSSAVQLLGSGSLARLALHGARHLLQAELATEEIDFLQQLGRCTQFAAKAARCIAPSVNYALIEEAQVAGLLQNLGIHLQWQQQGRDYLATQPQPCCDGERVAFEQQQFGSDPLQIVSSLIDSWHLDSFIGDSLRFLLDDPRQLEATDSLLRIARLAQAFVQSDTAPDTTATHLAERFFNLRRSETNHLFSWIKKLLNKTSDSYEQSRQLFSDGCRNLEQQMMLMASREAARTKLAEAMTMDELAQSSIGLYLETGTVSGAQLLCYDQQHRQLLGLAGTGHPRLSRDIRMPLLVEVSLATRAFEQQAVLDSFTANEPLTLSDRLLLRMCGGDGIMCQPLHYKNQNLGVVVFGIATENQRERLGDPSIRVLNQVVSQVLHHQATMDQIGFDSDRLLRRIQRDMGNSLTVITNYAEVLKHQLSRTEDRQLTDAIKGEVQLIDELVAYHLQQQDMPQFSGQEINLNVLLEETVEVLDDLELTPRQINVRYQLQKILPRVATRAILVRQILIHLIKNAAEAMDRGGDILFVTHEGYSPELQRFVEIDITDSGPGIDDAVWQHLFKPNSGTKGVGHNGKGLSLVKTMIEELGGRISCRSTPQTGTSFLLQIPLEPPHVTR